MRKVLTEKTKGSQTKWQKKPRYSKDGGTFSRKERVIPVSVWLGGERKKRNFPYLERSFS